MIDCIMGSYLELEKHIWYVLKHISLPFVFVISLLIVI